MHILKVYVILQSNDPKIQSWQYILALFRKSPWVKQGRILFTQEVFLCWINQMVRWNIPENYPSLCGFDFIFANELQSPRYLHVRDEESWVEKTKSVVTRKNVSTIINQKMYILVYINSYVWLVNKISKSHATLCTWTRKFNFLDLSLWRPHLGTLPFTEALEKSNNL